MYISEYMYMYYKNDLGEEEGDAFVVPVLAHLPHLDLHIHIHIYTYELTMRIDVMQ